MTILHLLLILLLSYCFMFIIINPITIIFFIISLIFGRAGWVSVDARVFFWSWQARLLPSCSAGAFHCGGFSRRCSSQPLDTGSGVVAMGLVAPWHVGSSWIRDLMGVSSIGKQIL